MHEMSLCEGVLQILEEHAKSQGFTRVKTVWLEIGCLAGVELDRKVLADLAMNEPETFSAVVAQSKDALSNA